MLSQGAPTFAHACSPRELRLASHAKVVRRKRAARRWTSLNLAAISVSALGIDSLDFFITRPT